MQTEYLFPDPWNYAWDKLNQWFKHEPDSAAYFSPKDVCMVVGSHGIGKTTFLKEFARRHDYTIQWITPDKCESSKDLLDQLNKYIYPSVETSFGQTNPRDVFIGIDNWDVLVSQDRSMFSTLQQFILSKRSNPYKRRMVCVCDRAAEKKFHEIHASIHSIVLKPMSDTDMCLVLKHRFPTLNLSILTHLADHCQCNLNRAIEMAQFELSSVSGSAGLHGSTGLHGSAGKKPATPLSALETPEVIPTLGTLYESKSPNEWFKLFTQDPWMYPLRFHENLTKELENRMGSKIVLYERLLSALIVWDSFMSRWINDEDSTWMDLPILVFSLTVYLTLESSRRLKKLKHSNESMMDFTKLLSQLSLQKKCFHTTFQHYQGSHYPIYDYPYHWIHEA
jgi:hypothetical protein